MSNFIFTINVIVYLYEGERRKKKVFKNDTYTKSFKAIEHIHDDKTISNNNWQTCLLPKTHNDVDAMTTETALATTITTMPFFYFIDFKCYCIRITFHIETSERMKKDD